MQNNYSKSVAKALLLLGAVKFSPENPFTYASGLVGPIYCDNRLLLSDIEKRDHIISAFLEKIERVAPFDVVAGVATAGIPYASIIADRIKKPLVYVRSKPKDHGKGNQIEGRLAVGSRVLLCEDLINQGGSSLLAVNAIIKHGAKVTALFSVVDYEMDHAKKILEEVGLYPVCLTNFKSLVTVAIEMGLIKESEERLLYSWQKNPVEWDKNFKKV